MHRIPTLFLVTFFIVATNHSHSQTPIIEWQKCYGGHSGDYATAVQLTSDHGYIMTGYTYGADGGDVMGYHGNQDIGDIWVVKTDINGNIQWQKCLGGTYFEIGALIYETIDGGYIVAGTSSSTDCSIAGNHGGADFWVVKLTSEGEISWQKMYGGSQNDYAYALDPTSDGGYIVAGFTESNDGDVITNHGERDFWIIKIDATGNLKWQKSLGGSGDDEIYSVKSTPDGGCIAAGFTESTDGDVTGFHGQRDYWVVKVDGSGNLQW
ncbi:MAG TPA: hypothetical protein VGI82_14345, partial [Chitinophagaceae bacterium]